MAISFSLYGADFLEFLNFLRNEGHEDLANDLECQVKRLSILDGMVGPSKWMRSTLADGVPLSKKWQLFINRRRQARHRAKNSSGLAQVRIRRDLRDRLMEVRQAGETLSDVLERLLPANVTLKRKRA